MYRATIRETGSEIPARSLQEAVEGIETALGLPPRTAVTAQLRPGTWLVYRSQAILDRDAIALGVDRPDLHCAVVHAH